jgi:hypothetical protein
MAAVSHVISLALAVRDLGQSEDLLRDLAADMEPEDGCITVLGLDDDDAPAFTSRGMDRLRELIAELRD